MHYSAPETKEPGATLPVRALARSGGRLHFLDALRGIAAAYVVFFHLAYVGGVARPTWLSGLIEQGSTGVMLFFVVSCFSLFFTMPARLKESCPVVSFFTHRFFRIAPLFYVWLAASCVIMIYQYHLPVTMAAVVTSVLFVFNLFPGHQDGIVMASWTIGVEMLFYAMFPLIYARTRDLTQACSLVMLTMLAYFAMNFVLPLLPMDPATQGSVHQWLFIKDLPVFAVGAVCYFVLADRLAKSRQHGTGRAAHCLSWLPPPSSSRTATRGSTTKSLAGTLTCGPPSGMRHSSSASH